MGVSRRGSPYAGARGGGGAPGGGTWCTGGSSHQYSRLCTATSTIATTLDIQTSIAGQLCIYITCTILIVVMMIKEIVYMLYIYISMHE